MSGFLVLEDGSVFHGRSVGAHDIAFGEAVFTTAMTGYQEIVTDPSYAEQLVCFTAPMVGNYGVADERSESRRPHARGVLMREARGHPARDSLLASGPGRLGQAMGITKALDGADLVSGDSGIRVLSDGMAPPADVVAGPRAGIRHAARGVAQELGVRFVGGHRHFGIALDGADSLLEEVLGELNSLYQVAPNYTEEEMRGITTPILIISGDHDEFVKADQPFRMKELIPNAQLAILPNTGHAVPYERPEEFNQLVLDFLAS